MLGAQQYGARVGGALVVARERVRREVLVVVDKSGSMAGEKFDQARGFTPGSDVSQAELENELGDLLFVLVNLVVDAVYPVIDPRIGRLERRTAEVAT